jgi:DNA-directed RNA polymerase specialized sigma24 family protein
MRFRPAGLAARFKEFKRGDMAALEAVIESESERLFDYLMRMTGQMSRSHETVLEVCQSVKAVADEHEDLQEFLVVFYKTARKFSIDIWNADTSRLENSAYGAPMGAKPDKDFALMLALESIVRSLPPKQREILILHERLGFSPDEIAEITSYGMSDVEEIFAQALGVAEAALTGDAEKVPALMTKLLPFPVPQSDDITTQNLSMVFKDLKKSSKSTPGGVLKLLFWILAFAAIGWCVARYEIVIEMAQTLLSRFEG